MMTVPALRVERLSVEFRTRSGIVRALDNVSFSVRKGETIALVGESGSGKSVTAYAVMGILDPAGRVTNGKAMFGEIDLLAASPTHLSAIRGREISMIFQKSAHRAQSDSIRRPPDCRRPDPPRQGATPRSTATGDRNAARSGYH